MSIVEGTVYEVLYQMPAVDKRFVAAEMKDPTGAIGRCGRLRVAGETRLDAGRVAPTPTTRSACTRCRTGAISRRSRHIYAPGLRKIKIFKEVEVNGGGTVCVHSVAAIVHERGRREDGLWGKNTHPDGVLDVDAWNKCSPRRTARRPPARGLPRPVWAVWDPPTARESEPAMICVQAGTPPVVVLPREIVRCIP